MGLDTEFIAVPKCEELETSEFQKELYYFRNHYDLDAFMQQLWREDSGDNHAGLPITEQVLKRIIRFASLTHDERKKECGEVSGRSSDDQWLDTRMECIPAIERMLGKGHKVYYRSW